MHARSTLALSRNPGAVDIDAVPEFIAASERNIDLAWVVHFLYDFAYLIFDMKQKVRANRSEEIDVLWREFLHTGVTGTANKNNYVPMAIMRLFWATAMDPELADLNHALRAIPLYCCAVVSSVCLLCRLWVHALAVFNI